MTCAVSDPMSATPAAIADAEMAAAVDAEVLVLGVFLWL